jgi:nucleoside-diphosphate kinase
MIEESMDKTLTIFKPDCLERKLFGAVVTRIEAAGFGIIAMKMMQLTKPMAESFYKMHVGKEFYAGLISFMTESPCVVAVLQKENAVEDYRLLMGATDPAKAEAGTIRHEFAENVRRNLVHGSDCTESALREIAFFFSETELLPQ